MLLIAWFVDNKSDTEIISWTRQLIDVVMLGSKFFAVQGDILIYILLFVIYYVYFKGVRTLSFCKYMSEIAV